MTLFLKKIKKKKKSLKFNSLLSHFKYFQMKEMNYITQNATNNSLIIIDELGRGNTAFMFVPHIFSQETFQEWTCDNFHCKSTYQGSL